MKHNGYFVKSIVALSLVGTLAMAKNSGENNGENDQNLKIQSSLHVSQNLTEESENTTAKIGVGEVVNKVKSKFSGKIIKVKLEDINGNIVYKAEVLQTNGKTKELFIDAGNGKVLASRIDRQDNIDENENEYNKEYNDENGDN